jgi:periplasmic divalent cation tolerance protein
VPVTPPPNPEAIVVLCSVPEMAVAERIATALLADELAACVNCVPGVRSLYRWEERIQDDNEVLLVIKTRAACFVALEAAIRARHPYEVPEIIALPVTAGATSYLQWIGQATGA